MLTEERIIRGVVQVSRSTYGRFGSYRIQEKNHVGAHLNVAVQCFYRTTKSWKTMAHSDETINNYNLKVGTSWCVECFTNIQKNSEKENHAARMAQPTIRPETNRKKRPMKSHLSIARD